MKPILAIDAVGAKHRGAAQVTLAIVEAAIRCQDIGAAVVFLSPHRKRHFSLPRSAKLVQVQVPWAESQVGRIGWLTRGLRRMTEMHRATHLLTLGAAGGVARPDISTSIFVQQSLPFSREAMATLPMLDRVRTLATRRMLASAAVNAKNLIVQTSTMADLVATELRFDRARIHVAPPGLPADVDPGDRSASTMASAHKVSRLLYVGNSAPYKNLGILARTLDDLRNSGRRVLLTATIESSHALARRPDVEALGMLDREQVFAQYRRASCLVMPSLTETVGLPMIEAMALGLPVIAADRAYAREICDSAALYFDPADAASLAHAIESIQDDCSLRARLAEAGARRAGAFPSGTAYDRVIDAVLN